MAKQQSMGTRLAIVVLAWASSVAVQLNLSTTAQATTFYVDGGHTYQIVTENRTWADAASDATSRLVDGTPGHLIVLESDHENTVLFDSLLAHIPEEDFDLTVSPDGGRGAYAWIGASDIVTEGQWIWDGDGDGTGTLFWQGTGNGGGNVVDGAYENWGHDPRNPSQQWEPDNASGQDAGVIGLRDWPRGFQGQWNDVRPTNLLYYIVEFDTLPRIGDANIDSVVDEADLEIVTTHLFQSGGWTDGDFNVDGVVDGRDFNLWLRNRDRSGVRSVPEPNLGLLACVGFLFCSRRLARGN
ncbi:MAG: hypothetical protein KDA60_19310 [Planctomycetales bacterium]|nr:hypothetical protein [Planctomycetales bacterium]